MLRSVGIPARMAVGFAEGVFDRETNVYTVRSLDAHAWPEVYFPDIGWIEFEPTGNQDELMRPNIPEDDELEADSELNGPRNPLDLGSPDELPGRKLEFEEGLGEEENLPPIEEQTGIASYLYLIAAVLLVVSVWLLNRQYAVFDKIPIRMQAVYERSGEKPPAWLSNWAQWAVLTPIERSFETVNRCLRLLGETPTIHSTPSERATFLAKKLPNAASAIETLTEQLQATLFTPHPGHAGRARRASLTIWLYTIQSIFHKILYGSPIE